METFISVCLCVRLVFFFIKRQLIAVTMVPLFPQMMTAHKSKHSRKNDIPNQNVKQRKNKHPANIPRGHPAIIRQRPITHAHFIQSDVTNTASLWLIKTSVSKHVQ